MQARSSRARAVRFKLVAASVIVLTVLLGLEALARVVGPAIPAYTEPEAGVEALLMNGHPTRLWYTAPGQKRSIGFTANINALGMRGPMPADPKPAAVPRVLVVGDSSLFGHGVADEETYPAQLEAVFLGLGRRVEVLNGGTPGYSTEQTRVFLDEVGWGLAPDLLVIGSLWSDNNYDLFRDEDLLHTQRAFANPFAGSALYRVLASWTDVLRGGRGARIVTWTAGDQEATPTGRRVLLPRYAQNLDDLVRGARSRGIGAVFLALTNIERVRMGTEGWSWEPYFEAQREVAAWHGVPIIDGQMVFIASNRNDPTDLFVDSMHPSALGHRLLAHLTARRLVADGWPASQRYLGNEEAFPGTQAVDSNETSRAVPNSPQEALFRAMGPPRK